MNKENQKRVTISLYKQDIEQLEFICEDTKMNKSDVIRQLIKKAATDQYNREIIARNSHQEKEDRAWESFKKKRKSLTTYNVQNEINADPMTGAAGSVSSNTQEYDRDLEYTIQVAKAKWIEEDYF